MDGLEGITRFLNINFKWTCFLWM